MNKTLLISDLSFKFLACLWYLLAVTVGFIDHLVVVLSLALREFVFLSLNYFGYLF